MGPPQQSTVHIRNINIRLPVAEARRRLGNIFSKFGEVLRVRMGAPGQAFVQFRKPSSASRALETAQGLVLAGRPLGLAAARHETAVGAPKKEGADPVNTTILIVEGFAGSSPPSKIEGPGSELISGIRAVHPKKILFLDFRNAEDCERFCRLAGGTVGIQNRAYRYKPGVAKTGKPQTAPKMAL